MINALDLTLVVLIVFFFIKNIGGPVRTIINLACVLLFLMAFGILTEAVLLFPVPESIRSGYRDSYIAKTSVVLIKWIYPGVQNVAPQVDKFMQEKVIYNTSPAVEKQLKENIPTIVIPQSSLPKLKKINLPQFDDQ